MDPVDCKGPLDPLECGGYQVKKEILVPQGPQHRPQRGHGLVARLNPTSRRWIGTPHLQ